jgi:hypothetical protein
MRFLIVLLFGTILSACNVGQSKRIEKPKKNERLVLFKTRIINYQPDTLDNSENELSEWTISNQIGDTTNYWVKTYLSSCSDYDGDVEFKNDSLFLDYWDISEVTCTEHVLYELTYKILNKERAQYKYELRRR